MADIATLGIRVDTSGVDRARDSLNNMRGAASTASSGVKDFSSASEQMNRQLQTLSAQQERTNQLLSQTNNTLQSGTIATHGYVDSMAKLATVVAGADLAYRGFSSAIDLAGRGMKEQVSVVSQLATGLQDLAKYGTNAFQLMSDQAINLQKSLIAIGNAVGVSGSAFAAFSQSLSRGGATGPQIAGAFPAVQGAIAGTTMEDINRREAITRLGIPTQGSPDAVAAAVVNALQKLAPSPERNVLAMQALGPGGADMVNQAMGDFHEVIGLAKTYQELGEANAKADIARAKARQEADEKNVQWYEAHPISSLLMSMVPGSAAGGVTATRLGATQRALGGVFNEAMGDQAGLGVWTDLKAALGIMGGGKGPGFGEYGKLGAQGTAVPPNLPGGYAAMAGVGMGQEQTFEDLAKQSEYLTENWQKLGLSGEQLQSAIEELSQRMQNAGAPVAQMVTSMQHAASLFQYAPGLPRQTQEALRSAAMKAAPTVGIGPAAAEAMNPEELIQRTGVSAPGAGVTAAVAEQSAGQQRDVLRGLQQATAAIRAQAGAAGGGGMAVAAAGIKAEEAYQIRTGMISAGDAAAQAGEKLMQASLRFEEAGNALIGRGRGAAARIGATAANLPVGGVVSPGGIISSAGFTAAEATGAAPGTQLGAGDPRTQAQTIIGAQQLSQQGSQLLEMLQTRIKLMQQSGGDMSTGSTASLKAQTGIVRYEAEVDAQIKAIQEEASARGGMTKEMQTAVDGLKELAKTASGTADEMVKAQQQMQAHRVMLDAQKQLSMAQTKLGAIQAGASPEQLASADLFQQFKSAMPNQGNDMTPEATAKLQAYATAIEQTKTAAEEAAKAQQEWANTLKSVVKDLADGLENAVYSGKKFHDVLREMMLNVSKEGFNYFVKSPLETAGTDALKSLSGSIFGAGGTPGGGTSTGPGSLTKMLSSTFGSLFGGGSSDQSGAGSSILPGITMGAGGAPDGVMPVFVTNGGAGAGGGVAGVGGISSIAGAIGGSSGGKSAAGGGDQNGFLSNIFGGQSSMLGRLFSNAPSVPSTQSDIGGPGGLGPEGGIGPNVGATPNSGGFMSGGLGGSLKNAISSGFNWLTSGWNSGQSGLGGMLGNPFGGGGSAATDTLGMNLPDNFGSSFGGEFGMGPGTDTIQGGLGDFGGFFAGGGVVGRDGAPGRWINPSVFIGAPRYAMGGMVGAGEVPIVAHRGEMVLNRQQQASLNKGGNTTHVHMNVTAGNLDGFRSSAPQLAMQMQQHVDRAQSRYG